MKNSGLYLAYDILCILIAIWIVFVLQAKNANAEIVRGDHEGANQWVSTLTGGFPVVGQDPTDECWSQIDSLQSYTQLVWFNFELPTPVQQCSGWTLEVKAVAEQTSWPYSIMRMQQWSLDQGESFVFDSGTHSSYDYQAVDSSLASVGDTVIYYSPVADCQYNAYYMQEEHPNANRIWVGFLPSVGQRYKILWSVLEWDEVNAVFEEPIKSWRYDIYPNPASNIVYVTDIGKSFAVYNILGRRVMDGVGQSKGFDVSGLPNGLYFLRGNEATVKLRVVH